jgi:hypothetical protein
LVLEAVTRIFNSYVPSDNEAQTERDLVRPVLEVLGHTFEVQAPLETLDGTKRPDYVFYRDVTSLNANKDRTLNEELLRGSAIAVGDAKYWDRPLDVSLKGRGDPFTNKNPGFQISFYMQHAGTEWGILTNGRTVAARAPACSPAPVSLSARREHRRANVGQPLSPCNLWRREGLPSRTARAPAL